MKYTELMEYIDNFMNNSFRLPEASWDSLDEIDKCYEQLNKTKDAEEKLKIAKGIYSKIKITIFKYSGEYEAVKNIHEYNGLIDSVNNLDKIEDIDIRLKRLEQIENAKYEIIRSISKLDNSDLKTSADINSDVLYSINGVFENNKDILSNEELYSLCINYFNLKSNNYSLDKVNKNIKNVIDKVWKNCLTNPTSFKNGDSFKFLIHNFTTGNTIEEQMTNMNKFREDRISCSLVTDSFMGIYRGEYGRRAGLIYPSDSKIITSGKHDLYSIEAGDKKVIKNKEYASSLITPHFLEDVGKESAKQNDEEFDYSSKYNEVVLEGTKPCAMYVIGYGEKDLNTDYEKMVELSKEMNLPLVEIDMCTYREKQGLPPLGDIGKRYIAMQTIYSYYGITNNGWNIDENKQKKVLNLISEYSEELGNKYIELKKIGNLSKEKMLEVFENMLVDKNLNNERDLDEVKETKGSSR